MKNPYEGRIFVSNKKEFPQEEHYAIIVFSSHMSPGYDAGEPEYSSPHVEYTAFTTRQAWEDEINRLESAKYGHKDYKAIYVKPAQIETKIVVKT